MRPLPVYPALYEINTRAWLTALSGSLGRPVALDNIPDAELDRIAALGFDWAWLLSVWQTGRAGQRVSRTNAQWRKEFQETLPDLREEDIAGSGFAITGYTVHESLGGDAALARLRQRLRERGLRLMLDFIPNHTGLDHPWVKQHPEFYVHGTEEDLVRAPDNYIPVQCSGGDRVLAHGRDPNFSGWPDTLQLNYGNPATREAMLRELMKIAGQCDGIRCDMAMLVLPEVFERTWGIAAEPFWPEAIRRVREQAREFCFLAEVYWDREWTLQQQGFDYTYDKRLYDRLREGSARLVREHFRAGLEYQNKLARFLENHDEPRAAAAFPAGTHQATAVVTYLSPGLRLFHQGQLQGRRQRLSPHLVRAPPEPVDVEIATFYEKLLTVLREAQVRSGQWQLLECVPAWSGNRTADCLLAFYWKDGADPLLATVNYAPHQSQAYVRLPFRDLGKGVVRLKDRMSSADYRHDNDTLTTRGLYLDLPPWGFHVFSVIVA